MKTELLENSILGCTIQNKRLFKQPREQNVIVCYFQFYTMSDTEQVLKIPSVFGVVWLGFFIS